MKSKLIRLMTILVLGCGALTAQSDTRGAIFGHVTDPTASAIPGAKIAVRNTLTGVLTELTTNEQGYYEAPLLIAGRYRVEVSSAGFRNAERPPFELPAGQRLEVDFKLELGTVSDTVTVSDTPPLLNTDNASTGMVLDQRNVRDLPWPGGNPMMLVWMAPGAQTTLSISDYSQRLHSGGPSNNVNVNGKVGGNEFTVDGTSNNANGRGVGFNPAPEFVQAVKVETSGFDASFGHSTGAAISIMTNSGTNQLHGNLREMHEQFSWRAADLFTKRAYYTRINQALAAGNTAEADAIRKTPALLPGRENSYAGSLGGPIVIPKLIDGRNKLFFFFGYAGFKVGEYRQGYYGFPSAAMRTGDFSQLLRINAAQYQIYDPNSTAPDPARAGHVVRVPFAGNVVPQSRIINPAYKWMAAYLPLPNTPHADNVEPNRNFTVFSAPYNEKYNSLVNRYDYNVSASDRVFFRWSYNKWANLNYTNWHYYATAANLWNGASQERTNLAAGIDWVHNFGATTLLNITVGTNRFVQENVSPAMQAVKPSDIGYPAYLDQKVSDAANLPRVNWSGWAGFEVPSSPFVARWRSLSAKADVSHMRASHTWKAGFDSRGQFYTGYNPGSSAGTFNYTATYTQRTDDGFQSAGTGNYGGSWASFMMGLPASASADVNASQVYGNPYYAAYVHDTWRVSSRFTLNLGLRMEYELGPTERYNRMIGPFDASLDLPITAAAKAAYGARPITEVPVSQFTVLGGATFPGSGSVSRKLWSNSMTWQPRVAAAYQITPRTVVRLGYGLFFDTLNVQNETPNQLGFSWATTTSYTTDFGQSWLVGNPSAGESPMSNPFPVRADGSRFDTPPGSKLGAMAPVGRGYTFVPYNRPHALQNRWRLDVQHQLTNTMVVNIGYAGSYSDRLPINQSLSALPAQYWWFGNTRNDTVAANLNTNLPNPYNIANFAGLRTSNPPLYQLMSTNSFFTSSTIRKSAILAPYSHMNGLTATMPLGKVRTHEMNASIQRRFADGSNFQVNYTKQHNYAADYFPNPFDTSPAFQPSNNGRPHRLTSVAVVEMPFGKGRRWMSSGPASWILGGFQVTEISEYQPGELVTWGSTLFYSGSNLSDICSAGPHDMTQWFDTSGFERTPSRVATTGQARTFPNRISGYGGCRGDSMKRFNGSLQREFSIRERTRLVLRWDVYNVFNHGQLALPNVSPTSTDFGRVTASMNNGGGSPASNRSMRILARILF